jgi:signal transduction histidine kinase
VSSRTDPWRALLLVTRVIGAAGAVALLALHEVTDYDAPLIAATVGYTALTWLVLARAPALAAHPLVWLVDIAVLLVLIYLSGDWRSPFYVMGMSSLVLPATSVPFRLAVLGGFGYAALYALTGIVNERIVGRTLQSAIRLETVATHLMLPVVVVVLLAYAAMLLERLRTEQERSERLAVQSERQRIAWELHDSAKQRVHAAHLLLSAMTSREPHPALAQALDEVRGAAADMETSVAELRRPLEDRPLHAALRERAAELMNVTPASINVEGRIPPLPPTKLSHVHRIAMEALNNAVRHAGASSIVVRLAAANGSAVVSVLDDGSGIPEQIRPGATGLRIMRDRAASIGAELSVGPSEGGRGTCVTLSVPTVHEEEP